MAGFRLPRRRMLDGRVSPLVRNGKTKLPQGYRNDRVRPEYVSHAYARGPNGYLVGKIPQAVSYGTRIGADVVDLVVDDFIRSASRAGWTMGMRRPLFQVADMKRNGASVGEPFDTRFATFEDLVENVPKHMLTLVMEQHLAAIECGERGFIPINRAHIKFDKYSAKKLREEKWRAIQASDVLTFMLFNHVFGEMMELGEIDHDRIVVAMNALKWHDHVAVEMNQFRTVGLDYSNFDETEPAHLLYRVTYLLAIRNGCSERMAVYLASTAAYSWTVYPDGEIWEKAGGNPSGQYLTSLLNSLINDAALTAAWAKVLGVPPSEVWGLRRYKIVGDDNVMQAKSAEEVVELADTVTFQSGFEVKTDLCGDDLYPVGAHAPFLSRVTVSVDGYQFTLPSEPTRLLSAWQVPDPSEPDASAVYEGLAQELYGYRLILECGLNWPVPQVVVDFLSDYEEKRLELGWVTVPLHEVLRSRVGLAFC